MDISGEATKRNSKTSRGNADNLHPKTISVKDDEIEFRHAWKSGAWHCLQPVSFDLVRTDSIRDKAHNVLGELTSVRDAKESLKVYLLVGKASAGWYERRLRKGLGYLGKGANAN
jgi:hypothetical protein